MARISGFFTRAIREIFVFIRGDFKRGENAAKIGPVISVVEQADVPLATKCVEELKQGARPFRKLKPAKALAFHTTSMATHHVSNVELGRFIVC